MTAAERADALIDELLAEARAELREDADSAGRCPAGWLHCACQKPHGREMLEAIADLPADD